MMNANMLGFQQTSNLRTQIRYLIALHGMAEFYKEVEDIFKSDYSFLTSYYKNESISKKEIQKQTSKKDSPTKEYPTTKEDLIHTDEGQEEEQQSIIDFMNQSDKNKMNAKGVIIKVKKESSQPSIQSQPSPVQSTIDVLEDEEVTQAKAPYSSSQPPKGLSGNAIKQWQKQQEEKRAEELKSQGIDGASLLTEENLKRWLEKEGRAYSQIARDIVGVPEATVAEMAKTFGIQSAAAKRRAAIVAMKMRR